MSSRAKNRYRGDDDEPPKQQWDLRLLQRLWPFVRPYRRAFLSCLGMLILAFSLEALRPYLLRCVVDGPVAEVFAGGAWDQQTLYFLGAAFLLSTGLSVFLGYLFLVWSTRNGQWVVRDVRNHLFSHLLRLSPRYFDHHAAGKLTTRVTADVENLNELISTGVMTTLFDLLKVLGLLAIMFCVHAKLALFTLLALPFLLLISLWFRRFARASFAEVRRRLAIHNGFAAEAIGGVRATRIFGQEASVQAQFDDLNQDTNQAWQQTVAQFSWFFAAVDVGVNLTQAGMLYMGGSMILQEELSIGVFLQFWLYFAMMTAPIKEIGEKYNVLQSAFASCERIFQILDQEPAPLAPALAKESESMDSPRGAAELSMQAVDFAYNRDKPVLRDVSFKLPAGQTMALVGPTGAGKTTVLSLVSRLQDPDAGQILLDGVDLRELDPVEFRRRIAVVPQEVFLFHGSILDNVRLFDTGISEQRVIQALQDVGAWDFVQQRPQGLHAHVEERGATFSQGEKQLLAFARALCTDPDLLVLDEATASIDSESEAKIQRALQPLLSNRTCLVVAHRLSTVRHADQILVMQDGAILEQGRHQELLAQKGLYAQMLQSIAL